MGVTAAPRGETATEPCGRSPGVVPVATAAALVAVGVWGSDNFAVIRGAIAHEGSYAHGAPSCVQIRSPALGMGMGMGMGRFPAGLSPDDFFLAITPTVPKVKRGRGSNREVVLSLADHIRRRCERMGPPSSAFLNVPSKIEIKIHVSFVSFASTQGTKLIPSPRHPIKYVLAI